MEGYFSTLREDAETLFYLPANDSKLFYYLVYRAAWKDGRLVKMGALFDSVRGLSDRTGLTVREIRTSLQHLTENQLISVKRHNNRQDICITRYINPAMGDTVSDKRTTNQRQTNDKRTTQLEEVKTLRSKEQINSFNVQTEFERVWALYPKPRGKKAALRHFAATVKTQADLQAIETALANYKADLKSNGTDLQYTQNGSTWFNDWQSWSRSQAPPKPTLSPPKEIPSWKIIPPPEDLVPVTEIQKLLNTLGHRNGGNNAT